MKFRLALCSEVYRLPVEETIEKVAAIGFDGLEIAPFTIAESVEGIPDDRRTAIRRAAERTGLEIIGLHWLLVSPPGLHLTTTDDDVRRRTVGYLRSLADFCADLGGRFMVLGSPRQRNVAPGDDPAAAAVRGIAGLRAVAEKCAERSVRLLLEPLHPAETNFLRTVEEAVEFAGAIGSPAVGYILDVKAMSGMPEGIEGTIARHGGAAGHFHANEPGGLGPGMGSVDFRPIVARLRESGYGGWISTEPFSYEPDADTVARTALEALRSAGA